MQSRLPFVLDVLGLITISAGAFLWSTVAGLVVSGLGCLGFSFLVERDAR